MLETMEQSCRDLWKYGPQVSLTDDWPKYGVSKFFSMVLCFLKNFKLSDWLIYHETKMIMGKPSLMPHSAQFPIQFNKYYNLGSFCSKTGSPVRIKAFAICSAAELFSFDLSSSSLSSLCSDVPPSNSHFTSEN